MKIQAPKTQSFLCFLLTTAMFLSGTATPVFSQQEKPVVISFGQPNIWSLEQAHYLLARMHRQNLDLQTAPLGDLDPNAANASRIDILKTLLEAGVKFDQAVALNNQLLKSDKLFNSQRRQELLTSRSTLQAESTQLARDIAALKIAKAAAKTDADAAPIQAQIDAKTEEKAAVDNQLGQTNDELKDLTSASGDFQKTEVTESFDSTKLTGDLDTLISKVQLINPTIAATLRLDNHIQMQYEIIAKQLTLLRDEVRPGERLVFLELPQSINATQNKADNKIAQTWWRIAGYTSVDKKTLLENELKDLPARIKDVETDVKENGDLLNRNKIIKDSLQQQLNKLCEQKEKFEEDLTNAKHDLEQAQAAEKAANEKLAGAQKSGDQKTIGEARQAKASADLDARANAHQTCINLLHDIDALSESLEQIDKAIRATKQAIQGIDDQTFRLQKDKARLAQTFTSFTTKFEKLRLELQRQTVKEQQNRADRLLQGGGADTSTVVRATINLMNKLEGFKKANEIQATKELSSANLGEMQAGEKKCSASENGRCYVSLASAARESNTLTETNTALLRYRAVRTIDIIPRQNAINVNDTKRNVSKTGIFAALSFLFGFAGKFTYERQHEQAQQFLNQELYTSGFGKGETDFGWNFYPFAGTKQLSPGIRTTYAVAIIPEDAESIVLKARGCYFPRKENQPMNYDSAGSSYSFPGGEKVGFCTPQEQVFVVPVPGGSGDGADYYITEMHYTPYVKSGDRMVVSIKGQNIPSQIGVLINGVPLSQSIGLGQTAIESILTDKVRENCIGPICGRFERVDSEQLLISFTMASDFTGTPRISLIGPGKAIELNKLYLNINGEDDAQLDSADDMFGSPANPTLRTITDFKVAPAKDNPGEGIGVLSGSKFDGTDQIYVNGVPVNSKTCRSDLCIVNYQAQSTDFLTVTISPVDAKQKAVSRTFVNPTSLSIISASVVSSEPGDSTHPAVLTVKLDGSGFKNSLSVKVVKSDGTTEEPKKIVPSAGQMVLKIVSPESVVQITLTDPDNNKSVSTMVVKPADEVKEKEK